MAGARNKSHSADVTGLEMEWEFGHETSPKLVYKPHAWKHIGQRRQVQL